MLLGNGNSAFSCNGCLKQEAAKGGAGLPGLLLLHLGSPREEGCFWGFPGPGLCRLFLGVKSFVMNGQTNKVSYELGELGLIS